MSEPETKTYRGESFEALLPLIREELGPDAVITRRREGVVGGIGGFFGKKCVEIEACGPLPVPTFVPRAAAKPTLPSSAIVDIYDGPDEEDEPAVDDSPLLEALLAQASPFAVELAEAVEAASTVAATATIELAEEVELPEAVELAEEVELIEVPELPELAPAGPFENHVRQALARRLRVANGGGAKRRIVLVGPAGAGRTAAAARLCTAFARTGASVSALSLEPGRAALELAAGTESPEIGFH